MSNYPPGVTGNEYEIAGADYEFEEEFECSNERFRYVRISEYAFNYCSQLGRKANRTDDMIQVKENYYTYISHINSLFNMPDISPEVIIDECGYSGVVLKEAYRGKIFWCCPKCGMGYEEEIERYSPYE